MTFNTNLTSLFSVNHDDQWQTVQQKIESNLNTGLLYLVGHSQQSEAIKAAEHLVESVK